MLLLALPHDSLCDFLSFNSWYHATFHKAESITTFSTLQFSGILKMFWKMIRQGQSELDWKSLRQQLTRTWHQTIQKQQESLSIGISCSEFGYADMTIGSFICFSNPKIHLAIRATWRVGAAVSVLLALFARCILRLEEQTKRSYDLQIDISVTISHYINNILNVLTKPRIRMCDARNISTIIG